jgi:hypothetical protein
MLSKNVTIIIYRAIILPVVLYGRDLYVRGIWSLILKDEHTFRYFENRGQRRIFGLKKEDLVGGWRKLHNEKLHKFYSSPSIIRMIRSRSITWTRHVASMGEKGNAPEEKRPLGR